MSRYPLCFVVACCLFLLPCVVFSQRRALDLNAYKTWPVLKPEGISNDGKYVTYDISTAAGGDTLWVEALDRRWKRGFAGGRLSAFSQSSRQLIFMLPKDSM